MKMPQPVIVSLTFIAVCGFGFLVAGLLDILRQQRQLVTARNLAMLPTQPCLPTVLPTVLPAQAFDHSEKRDPGAEPLTYCPTCYLQATVLDGWCLEPQATVQQFCVPHAYTTLARAMERKATTR